MADDSTAPGTRALWRSVGWTLAPKLTLAALAVFALYASLVIVRLSAVVPKVAAAREHSDDAIRRSLQLRWELGDKRAFDGRGVKSAWQVSGPGSVDAARRAVHASVAAEGLAPFATATVQVAGRSYTRMVNAAGEVEIPVEVPELVKELRVSHALLRADSGTEQLLLPWPSSVWESLPPAIDLVRRLHGSPQVWVVGRASGSLVASAPAGVRLTREGSFFEAVLPYHADAPNQLVIERNGRRYVLELGQDLPEATGSDDFGSARTLSISFDKAGSHHYAFELTLPEAHPAFRALVGGDLDARGFLDAMWRAPIWMGNVSSTITRTEHQGTVRIECTGGGPQEKLWLAGDRDAWPADVTLPPSAHLLHSAADSINVHFGDVTPAWFDAPLPTQLDGHTAVWRGPLPTPDGLSFALELPAGARVETERPPPAAPGRPKAEHRATMQDWVSTDTGRERDNLLASTYRVVLWIAPALALALLALRAPFGRRRWWPPLAAGLFVVAGFSFASALLPQLLDAWESPWLWRWLLSVKSFNRAGDFEESFATPRLLVLVGGALLTPAIGHAIECQIARQRPPREQGAARARGALRIGWLVLSAAPLFGLYALDSQLRFSTEPAAAEAWLAGHLQVPEQSRRLLGQLLRQDDGFSLAYALTYCMSMLAFGWRGLALGAASVLLFVRLSLAPTGLLDALRATHGVPLFLQAIAALPLWGVVGCVLLAGLVSVEHLLRLALLERAGPARSWLRWVAFALVAASAVSAHASTRLSLLVIGSCLLASLLGVLLRAARRLRTAAPWLAPQSWTRAQRLGLLGFLVALAWPSKSGDAPLRWTQLMELVYGANHLTILASVVLFVLALKAHDRIQSSAAGSLEPQLRNAGVVLFTFYVASPSGTWSYLPVSMILAWLIAEHWLLERSRVTQTLGTNEQRRQQLTAALEAARARARLRAAERALDKQASAGDLMPDELEKRLQTWRSFYAPQLLEASQPSTDALPFASAGESAWRTGCQFTATGALLSSLALAIALYQYLPERAAPGVYPPVELLRFLSQAAASWLLAAFFFGYFFTAIRGPNGLQKGLALCAAIVIPKLAFELLRAAPLDELQSTGAWAALTFAFCALLGGIADYRTMRAHGFKLRDLLVIHDLPWISVYASSLAAALVSAGVTLLSGKLGEIAKLFIGQLGPTGAGH